MQSVAPHAEPNESPLSASAPGTLPPVAAAAIEASNDSTFSASIRRTSFFIETSCQVSGGWSRA